MKKYLLTLFSVLVSVTLMGQTSFLVQSSQSNGHSYELTCTIISETNNVKVSIGNVNEAVNFEIPETVQYDNTTYTVTEIAADGFKDKSNVKGITIPETITKIGNYAFKGTGLTSVAIPNSVTVIGDYAFQNCNDLSEVNVGSGVTLIGDYAFANSNIEEIYFAESSNTVTMETHVFHSCNMLHYIALPKMNSIPESFFESCSNLDEIIVPAGVTSIGEKAFAQTHDCEIIFLGCGDESGDESEDESEDENGDENEYGFITIASNAFQNCERDHFEFICLERVVVLRVGSSTFSAFGNGAQMHVPCGLVTEYAAAYPSNITIEAAKCVSITRRSGHFCLPETWVGFEGEWNGKEGYMAIFVDSARFDTPELWYAEKEKWLKNYNDIPGDDRYPDFVPRNPDHPFIIKEGHTVTLNHKRPIHPFNSINEGVLVVNAAEGGELIEVDVVGEGEIPNPEGGNMTVPYNLHENLGGEIEIVVPTKGNAWNFVGAPFNGYNLYALKLGPAVNGQLTDATVVEFDYLHNDWSMNYSYADEDVEIQPGRGFLVWPFYDDKIVFSTVEDRRSAEPPQEDNNSKSPELKIMESDFELNNDDVVVSENVTGTDRGHWMALSNPYPAKICLNDFLSENSDAGIQGEGIYVHNAVYNSFTLQLIDYDIAVGQGFFVNFDSEGEKTITFEKSFLHEQDVVSHASQSNAKAVEKEFIRFAMIEGERESEVLFAHNQDAQEGYDIFDANKLFAMSHIAEPYFVVDGISLVKEEVNLLPYYATMNVKSFGNKEVKFRPNYIPEGLSVTLIDGEESIDLLQGQEYATEISAGENANRFKLLIKKSVGLGEVEELEVEITNSNRLVNVSSTEEDLQIEVYNALGQKVFETKALNFSLNNVSAGAYMIKAFNNKASKTQKIVVK